MSHALENSGLYEARREHDACGIGLAVNINAQRDHSIIEYGRQILLNLHHRGAAGADEVTGDGAGILFQIPHEFFQEVCLDVNIALPKPSQYGVGMVFCPKDRAIRNKCERVLEEALKHHGLEVLGWRDVPAESDCLGKIALDSEPSVRQVFAHGCGMEEQVLERKLYLARRRAENFVHSKFGQGGGEFYIASLSSRTICYKGMFMARQLFAYYPDLVDERLVSALAIVHQRYSTNTFPSWQLAQPLRCIAHNGEINTLSGNRNQLQANQSKMSSKVFGDDMHDLFPVVAPDASDSACFDNVMELLVRSGRSMPHAMMMMIPEAFGADYHISNDKRAFYEYHASFMEPWDGPAAMAFTDGTIVGGILDRNGLRPCRYLVTTDGLLIMASEAGVVDVPPEKVRHKGRLRPGHMFLVDTSEKRLILDNEIKGQIARQSPYRRWLDENKIELRGMFDVPRLVHRDPKVLAQKLRWFGYTREELKTILLPMACNAQEPIGSMGNDAPLAVLSNKPQLLFNYFKQLFAQVTNPPIDPLREGMVMSLMNFVGKKPNVLTETPEHCRQLKLSHPILANEDIERLSTARRNDLSLTRIPALFDVNTPDVAASLKQALDELVASAQRAIRQGASLIAISDRDVSRDKAPIPSLLATAAVHHGLLNLGIRGEASLIVESAEPREVMHFCLLCGFGANAINPYLVFETLEYLQQEGELPDAMESIQIADNYIVSIKKGILKTISKMGISTLRSYTGAQLFEAIGLSRSLVDKYFTGTSSRIGGIGLEEIARDAVARHQSALAEHPSGLLSLDYGGEYHFRHGAEEHLWNPEAISKLQHAVTYEDQAAYDDYAHVSNNQARKLCTLRGLFEFVPGESIPIDHVEPAEEIVKRFCTGAMSHGSISKETHECMAIAMNRIGAMSNTGEGGEDPSRYIPEANGDSRNCAIKQIASGRFGVTAHYLANAKELQIKISQGAKPGEGGQLPGHKVTEEIARLRHSTPGVTLISPPPHHDIYSIEDLAQLIYDLKCSNPGVKVSVKLVAEVGVGTIAAGIAKGNADEVLISGHDGGTGASPLSSIKHTGCPWELGLAETQQVLVLNDLRGRIRLQTDGQLRTGRDVVIAALLGAEQFGFGTSVLVTLGCTLLRKCHEGACPFGISTQDPALRERFAGKPEYITRFMHFMAEEARQLMADMGFRTFDDMIGRVDRLQTRRAIEHWKSAGLDLSSILHQPLATKGRALRLTNPQADKLGDHLDWQILKTAQPAIESRQPTVIEMPIRNTNRTVGAILSNRIVKQHGREGLPQDTLNIILRGCAGQSFGAFLAPGVTLTLVGDSNDYLGKSLSGGRIVVKIPDNSTFRSHENIIVGNTVLYGATSGEAFINGMAGERFCVRNSGVTAVVEGVGDHGCEYMTDGLVVVLGKTGCNFAAGMSGGIAYVLDEAQMFDTRCNLSMVDLERVWKDEDKCVLHGLISRHRQLTGSERAEYILDAWPDMVGKFVKVVPIDYREALEKIRAAERRSAETMPPTEEVLPWVK